MRIHMIENINSYLKVYWTRTEECDNVNGSDL